MSKSIRDIYARRGKRGEVERFDFSGAEAKKEIDQYIDTIKATKADLDADKAASAEYADRAEKASSSAEQSASLAAEKSESAISSAKSAKKSADDAAKVKTSVDISEGNATSAASVAKSWAVGPSSTEKVGTDTNNAKYWADIARNSVSSAGVNSWNGRSGAVTPQDGDYTAEMVGALPYEGTAVAASKLSQGRKITASLELEGGYSFDGTKDVSVGIFGTLSVAHGGTGGTTAADARKKLGVPSTDTASTSANGLMSSADKNKLNGVEEGANNTVVDNELSSFSTNPVQNKVVNEAIVEINEKLNGIEDGANKTIVDEALSSTSTNPVQNKAVNSIITDLTGQVTGVKDSCSSMWTASQAYVAGQYAIYNNYIYRCTKNATAGTLPTDTTYWVKTDLASEITSLNSNLAKNSFQQKYSSYASKISGIHNGNKTYATADIVGRSDDGKHIAHIRVIGYQDSQGTEQKFDWLKTNNVISGLYSSLGFSNYDIKDPIVPLANSGIIPESLVNNGVACIVHNNNIEIGRFYNDEMSFGSYPVANTAVGRYSFEFYASFY